MEEKQYLLYMILGTIGTTLIAVAAMRYQAKINDDFGYAIIFFGFILSISYINYLEKRRE